MIKIYGIQNCDSCKKTQKWFFNESININFHDYRLDGINKEILMYFNTSYICNHLSDARIR